MTFSSAAIQRASADTDLDFFWHMMGSCSGITPFMLEEAHEEAVDDACATFMAGHEL